MEVRVAKEYSDFLKQHRKPKCSNSPLTLHNLKHNKHHVIFET